MWHQILLHPYSFPSVAALHFWILPRSSPLPRKVPKMFYTEMNYVLCRSAQFYKHSEIINICFWMNDSINESIECYIGIQINLFDTLDFFSCSLTWYSLNVFVVTLSTLGKIHFCLNSLMSIWTFKGISSLVTGVACHWLKQKDKINHLCHRLRHLLLSWHNLFTICTSKMVFQYTLIKIKK